LAAVSAACAWRFRHLDDFANRDDMVAQRLPQVLASFGERARPAFDRFLALTAGHESQEPFQLAEESLQLWDSDGLPLNALDKKTKVKLNFRLTGSQDNFRLELSIQKKPKPAVRLHSVETDLAFRGWVDEIDCQEEIACPTPEAAQALANTLLRHALIVGFRLA
jgi:hypothetical protein